MTDMHELRNLIGSWARKAEHDLTSASATLKVRPHCPSDTVCFHAQQCAEKYLKALLVLRGISFPRTHDIEALVALLPSGNPPPLTPEEEAQLTRYATISRYPGDYPEPTLTEAREAVRIARRVRRWCRKLLPRAVLRKE